MRTTPTSMNTLRRTTLSLTRFSSHGPNPAVQGGIEFKVKAKGYGKSQGSWVPPSSFVPGINKVWECHLGQKDVHIFANELLAAIIQAEDDILLLTDPFVYACCTAGG